MQQDKQSIQSSSAFGLLFSYIGRDKPLLVRAAVLLMLATGADVAGPLLAKLFIDDYLMQSRFAPMPLAMILAAYLFTQIGSAWLRYQQTLRFTDIALAAVKEIRQRVFSHVLKLPIAWYDRAATGQLVSRITNDTEAIKDLYVQFLSTVLTNAVLLIGIIIAMALLDLRLMAISLLLIPGVIGLIYLYQRLSGAAVAASRQHRSEINNLISESIAGMPVIQAGGQQGRFSDYFEQLNTRYYASRMRTIRVSALLLRPAIDLLSISVLIAVIWGFGQVQVEGAIEIGVLYAYLNFLGRFTEPLAEITQRFNLYQQAMVAGARVQALLQQPLPATEGAEPCIPRGGVRFSNVSFAYRADKPVLKQLSLEIPAGSFIGIVGHTGSGKSTLLNLLLNFYPVSAGTLTLDDRTIDQYSQQALRDGIALIPQEPFIKSASLRENIDMGRNLPQLQIEKALHEAGLGAFVSQLPQGLETLLGERGTRLSTGQRQQLVIARALAATPRILLLDEATANVDSETESVVQQALNKLHGQTTLIVVAHRLSTIRRADRILVMRQGEVVERGTHAELMQSEHGIYRGLYRLQYQAQQVEMAEHQ
ncbi:multidrug ABC transporter ATP-binding protein [Marinobacterium zhoushanense]|uniref:Multidrug ABC transporter ATP-binding protein n=1 Tax=Marinobacterium zhoushanense TaxID=1679163 RepID=A0ABQ1KB21_9GAMM|nr:ABC transporter transmembrane domain-containing protein [Marinobacterium zhoushanense]GGB93333.1 multidrug ABC transporter ATP-binding protein [Marinobacterium zhoushanense]